MLNSAVYGTVNQASYDFDEPMYALDGLDTIRPQFASASIFVDLADDACHEPMPFISLFSMENRPSLL